MEWMRFVFKVKKIMKIQMKQLEKPWLATACQWVGAMALSVKGLLSRREDPSLNLYHSQAVVQQR